MGLAEVRQFSVLRTSSVYMSIRENSRELSSLLHTVVIGPTERLITFQSCCVCMSEWLRGVYECHTQVQGCTTSRNTQIH